MKPNRSIEISCSSLAAALLMAAAGCESNPEVAGAAYTGTYYPYAYYYPTDYYYSGAYYADPYYGYPTFYSARIEQAETASGHTPGSVLRALAMGEDVCPGQAEVQDIVGPVACGGDDDGMQRTGAHVILTGCTLDDGSMLDGTLDVTSTHSFSDTTCNESTVVGVTFDSRFTNFVYTAPDGSRTVLTNLESAGSYTRLLAERPTAISIASTGGFERYDASGALLVRVSLTGSQGLIVQGTEDNASYKVNGTLSTQDMDSGTTQTLTGAGLKLDQSCCHPTAGTLRVARTATETDEIVYGPACAQASVNDEPVWLPPCP